MPKRMSEYFASSVQVYSRSYKGKRNLAHRSSRPSSRLTRQSRKDDPARRSANAVIGIWCLRRCPSGSIVRKSIRARLSSALQYILTQTFVASNGNSKTFSKPSLSSISITRGSSRPKHLVRSAGLWKGVEPWRPSNIFIAQ